MSQPPAVKNNRRGSFASDKVISAAVRNRRMVTVHGLTPDPIDGWVSGADDYHWVVVDKRARTHLVHKSSGLLTVTLHPLDDETSPVRDLIGPIVEPYRQFVLAQRQGDTQT